MSAAADKDVTIFGAVVSADGKYIYLMTAVRVTEGAESLFVYSTRCPIVNSFLETLERDHLGVLQKAWSTAQTPAYFLF